MAMNRKSAVNMLLVLGAAVAMGTEAWGEEAAEKPVKARFISVKVGSEESWMNGQLEEGPLQLVFEIRLDIKPHLSFQRNFDSIQYLEMTDSSGRKLAPVEFNLGYLYQQGDDGEAYACVFGKVGELPLPDVAWLRLKGMLKVPVARLVMGPVYELVPKRGTEMHVPLPRETDDKTAAPEDIVVAGDPSTGRLFLDEYEVVEKKGKKTVTAEIGLKTDSPFELEGFQVLDAKDAVLKTDLRGSSSGRSGDSRKWTRSLRFEAPKDFSKMRIRMVYRVPVESVAVPVDAKIGMRGEIPEEPEKGKGGGRR